jgi:hypothetical protein
MAMARHEQQLALSKLTRIRRRLDAPADPAGAAREVLRAGSALMSFTRTEDQVLASLFDLLEPSVRAELTAEHQAIAEDLGLLESLQRTGPDSPDATTLAASLAARMCRHIDRDVRLLQCAAVMR